MERKGYKGIKSHYLLVCPNCLGISSEFGSDTVFRQVRTETWEYDIKVGEDGEMQWIKKDYIDGEGEKIKCAKCGYETWLPPEELGVEVDVDWDNGGEVKLVRFVEKEWREKFGWNWDDGFKDRETFKKKREVSKEVEEKIREKVRKFIEEHKI